MEGFTIRKFVEACDARFIKHYKAMDGTALYKKDRYGVISITERIGGVLVMNKITNGFHHKSEEVTKEEALKVLDTL